MGEPAGAPDRALAREAAGEGARAGALRRAVGTALLTLPMAMVRAPPAPRALSTRWRTCRRAWRSGRTARACGKAWAISTAASAPPRRWRSSTSIRACGSLWAFNHDESARSFARAARARSRLRRVLLGRGAHGRARTTTLRRWTEPRARVAWEALHKAQEQRRARIGGGAGADRGARGALSVCAAARARRPRSAPERLRGRHAPGGAAFPRRSRRADAVRGERDECACVEAVDRRLASRPTARSRSRRASSRYCAAIPITRARTTTTST